MNLILLTEADFIAADRVRLADRRAQHVRQIHRATAGDTLVVGKLDGDLGRGRVVVIDDTGVELAVQLETPPPPKAPVIVLLALPRPKALRRMLQHLPTFGIERLVLLNAFRVEKSFWSSPLIADASIQASLRLGLEQARDTRPPAIEIARWFRPFVEDILPAMSEGRRRLLAHPYAATPCPHAVSDPVVLAIGPEGGWIDFELTLLAQAGFDAVSLGPRVLRTEAALPTLLGRILP